MAKRFLLLVNGKDPSKTNKKASMIKTFSFTTDEDDAAPVVNSQSISDDHKALSINSASIASLNNENNASKLVGKLTKRRSRPRLERQSSSENKPPPVKESQWYKKINLLRPLMFVGMLILLYLMWTQRDVWVDRLLTSSTRIRKPLIVKKEQTIKESTDSSKTITTRSSKDSTSDSFDQGNTIENTEKIDVENNNEDLTSSSAKSSTSQKINIRLRRNKMSFSKESQKKKRRHQSQNSSVDDNNGEKKDEQVKTTEPILSPTKKRNRPIIEAKISENHPVLESAYDNGIEQLRKNLKSKSRDRDFLLTLAKKIGLNKDKLDRFIYKKDTQFMTLQTFISLLDSFNLMFLIVPK